MLHTFVTLFVGILIGLAISCLYTGKLRRYLIRKGIWPRDPPGSKIRLLRCLPSATFLASVKRFTQDSGNLLLPAILAVILAGLFSSCAQHPQAAVLQPARQSNEATRQHIKNTQKHIDLSEVKMQTGATALQKADANLNKLLSAPVTRTSAPERTMPRIIVTPTPTPTPTPPPTPITHPSLFKRIFGSR